MQASLPPTLKLHVTEKCWERLNLTGQCYTPKLTTTDTALIQTQLYLIIIPPLTPPLSFFTRSAATNEGVAWWWVPVVGPHIGAVLGVSIYEVFVGLHHPEAQEFTLPQVTPHQDTATGSESCPFTTSCPSFSGRHVEEK